MDRNATLGSPLTWSLYAECIDVTEDVHLLGSEDTWGRK